MDKDVQEILSAAADYVHFVAEKLGHDRVRQRSRRSKILARFLFPQFDSVQSQEKLGSLIAFHEWAEAVANGQENPADSGPDEDVISDAVANDANGFAHKQARIAVLSSPEIVNALTPVQRRLLEQMYFKVRIR